MFQTTYTDSLHQRLDASMYGGGDYASSSTTTRSSFSQPSHTQQQDVPIISSNPWGAPEMFATDPKLAAFYGDAAVAAGVSLTPGADGLMHESYDYAENPNLLGELDIDGAAHRFSPEDIDAILASGILDNNNNVPYTSGSLSTILQHQRPSQQLQHLLYPSASDLQVPQQYDESYVYSQLQDRMRIPSLSSIMGLAPSPPFFPSSSPSPQDHNVVRADSQIIVHSPQPARQSDPDISIGSPQTAHEPAPPQLAAKAQKFQEQDTAMDVSTTTSQSAAVSNTPATNVLPTNRYSLVDFAFHHTLGTGSFGRVHLGKS